MTHEDYMREAIKEAEIAMSEGSGPFGVVVVNENGEIVERNRESVKKFMDPTAHGEVNAIRNLCKKLNTLHLSNMIFYTTSEPCPTCLSSCIKARVKAIYYGADTEPTASLPVRAKELASKSNIPIEITSGILAEECLKQREGLNKKS